MDKIVLGCNARWNQNYVFYYHLLKPGGGVFFISSMTHPPSEGYLLLMGHGVLVHDW